LSLLASPVSCSFSFLPILRLPRSTLFPYTTLFRSLVPQWRDKLPDARPRRLAFPVSHLANVLRPADLDELGFIGRIRVVRPFPRSEEHTSELQSRRDLVCRLLLEKKKKRTTTIKQT